MRKAKLPDLPIKPQQALFIGIFLALILPLLFSQFSLAEWLDFSDTGEIGDTIGGITAPIINITAAILIYYSFREQFLANKIFEEERQINNILNLIEGLDNRIQMFKFTRIEPKITIVKDIQQKITKEEETTKERVVYNGTLGILEYCNTIFRSKELAQKLNSLEDEIGLTMASFSELYHVIGITYFIAKKIQISNIQSSNKKDLIERLDITYVTVLKTNLNTFFEAYEKIELKNQEIKEMKSQSLQYLKIKDSILNS